MKKIKVGILGATGMVGQRLITLLTNHPWFEIEVLAASPRSAGKTYLEAVRGRWKLDVSLPDSVKKLRLEDASSDLKSYAKRISLIFSALDMEKQEIINLENSLAGQGLAVVSNNSAHRWSEDVPMVIPEINQNHLNLIKVQRKNRNWKGFIVVKPNCSIQSYLPVIFALKKFHPIKVSVATLPEISATCIRVPVSDGHLASISVKFKTKPTSDQIEKSIDEFNLSLSTKGLPTSPSKFIHNFKENNRPQTRLDRDLDKGMAISAGRWRQDNIFDWKFIALSHNTIRGAAGGSVLTAELLVKEGYI